MSHVSTVETVINDLVALKQAAESLGLEFVDGQQTYKWYNSWQNDYAAEDAAYKHGFDPKNYGMASHAIKVPGNDNAYEVGVVDKGNGTFGLVFDHWQGGFGLCAKIGQKGEKLNQAYIKIKVEAELQKKGFNLVEQTTLANGSIHLRLQGPPAL